MKLFQLENKLLTSILSKEPVWLKQAEENAKPQVPYSIKMSITLNPVQNRIVPTL